MPTDILSDERVEKLIAETGVPGFGLYIYLVCEIMRHRKHCMTRDCIMSIKIKGHTKATLKRIVEDYGLFTDDGKGHIFSQPTVILTVATIDLPTKKKASYLQPVANPIQSQRPRARYRKEKKRIRKRLHLQRI